MENVLLVFGGKSYEHDISVVTASQIFNKTKIDNVKLIPLYVSKDERFFVYNSNRFNIKDFSEKGFKENTKNFKEVVFVSGEKCRLFSKTRFGLKEYIFAENAIFACHGDAGENGKLVAFFERFGIETSAGDFDSLGVCMNKFLFKQIMRGLNIPVVSGFKITKFNYFNRFEDYKFRIKFLKFPIILKSNNGGSSIGLFVVKTREEFESKLKEAFEFDDEVLVEDYQENVREFNVAILGDSENFVVSEIDEPLKENEILTFADKYLSKEKNASSKIGLKMTNKTGSMDLQSRKFPADLSQELVDKIKDIAKKIFVSLKLKGIVRIDFLYKETKNKLFVCEVNAIPGSLAYYFFDNNKISTNDLVSNLLKISKRGREKFSGLKKEYFTNILE